MKIKHLATTAAWGLGAIGGAMLVYGALVESKRLVREDYTLPLEGWPERLRGYRIAVVGDFHLRDEASIELAQRAVAMALDADPDIVVLPGDLIARWRTLTPWMLGAVLEPLLTMDGSCVAVPGNHEYHGGTADLLGDVLEEFDIRLLRNETWRHDGILWTGVDSFNAGEADVERAFSSGDAPKDDEPRIVVWHEPDTVELLPPGAALQISGHSHGGQFRFPGGLVPMKSENGVKYLDGFYPASTTPIFVTRGVGTTGPPSRFLCPPQVAVLEIVPAEASLPGFEPVAEIEPAEIERVGSSSGEDGAVLSTSTPS